VTHIRWKSVEGSLVREKVDHPTRRFLVSVLEGLEIAIPTGATLVQNSMSAIPSQQRRDLLRIAMSR
jgi:hypothetical protein